jgi:uncharacterized protein YecA (UPF0149 family)
MAALRPQHAEAQSVLNTDNAAAAAPVPAADPFAAALMTPAIPGAQAGGQQPQSHVGADSTFVRGDRKVGRNELCPCGSGKKFKHCHGTLTSVE